MLPDLLEALRLLNDEFGLSEDANGELLLLLERADEDHPLSVLRPERRAKAIFVASGTGSGGLWLIAERIYEYTFLVFVRETAKGQRAILSAIPINDVSGTP